MAGRTEPNQAQFITIRCEGWPCEQRSACMFGWRCSPLLRLVTERYVCPWLVAFQTPLTFPAAQQRDSAEAQVTRSADGSSVSAASLVPSSTKLFPTKNTNHSIHLAGPTTDTESVQFLYHSYRSKLILYCKSDYYCTCCLKYLLSSSSTSTKFKKYLTENFLFTSLIVAVRS